MTDKTISESKPTSIHIDKVDVNEPTLNPESEREFDEKFNYEGDGEYTTSYPSVDENDVPNGVVVGWSVPEEFKQFIAKVEQRARDEVTENTSDGYHTFKELYEFRKLYNSALFNEWANGWNHGFAIKYDVHKSKLHHDGEKCFGGGWFIVMAETPEGQISNHYELKDWDLFNIPEKEKANEWDGHTAQDVVRTLKALSTPPTTNEREE